MEIIGKEIRVNRGDRATIRLKRKDTNFSIGDVIKFSVVDKQNYNNVLLQKTVTITESSEYAYIPLTKQDTTFGDIKNKSKEYRYEIEYNNDLTLIGANEDDDNVFVLFAEAGDR